MIHTVEKIDLLMIRRIGIFYYHLTFTKISNLYFLVTKNSEIQTWNVDKYLPNH